MNDTDTNVEGKGMNMGHGHQPTNFGKINRKKLAVIAIIAGVIGLILLVVAFLIAMAIFNAVAGQTGSSTGQSSSGLVSFLWNTAQQLIQALWKQIIANPLQFFMGGGN